MMSTIKQYFITRLLRNRYKLEKEDNTFYQIDNSARVSIGKKLLLHDNATKNGRSSILRMDKESQLLVHGFFSFYYGADVICFHNASLELGDNSFINSDCKIRCHESIVIGDNCAISHDFTVMDSDGHTFNGKCKTKPVRIGNNVWIGTHVTVLKGVTIGDGAVIGAGSVVVQNVPARCLAAGVPARVIKENVTWG